jgi:multiple sugar transport system substrate-binding protein
LDKEDFLRAAQRLTLDTDGDGIIDQYGMTLSCDLNRWPLLALQNGVSFKDNIQKEALVKTLIFIHDLLYRYRIATLSPRYQLNSEAFIREKAAMMLTTSIELAGWRNDGMTFEPQVAPMPFGEQQASLLIANVMMIPANCNEEELALLFLRKALSFDIQQKISRNQRFMSVLQDVNEATFDKTLLKSLNIVGNQIANSQFLHELFSDLNVAEEIESEMELYWAGLESAPHFVERLLQIIDGK